MFGGIIIVVSFRIGVVPLSAVRHRHHHAVNLSIIYLFFRKNHANKTAATRGQSKKAAHFWRPLSLHSKTHYLMGTDGGGGWSACRFNGRLSFYCYTEEEHSAICQVQEYPFFLLLLRLRLSSTSSSSAFLCKTAMELCYPNSNNFATSSPINLFSSLVGAFDAANVSKTQQEDRLP